MHLTPCPGCRRHVRAGSGDCPFCHRPLQEPARRPLVVIPDGVPRTALAAIGALLALEACSSDKPGDRPEIMGGNVAAVPPYGVSIPIIPATPQPLPAASDAPPATSAPPADSAPPATSGAPAASSARPASSAPRPRR